MSSCEWYKASNAPIWIVAKGGQVDVTTWHLRPYILFNADPDTKSPNFQMATHGYLPAIDSVTMVYTHLLWSVYIPNVQDRLKYIGFAVVRSCVYDEAINLILYQAALKQAT